MERSKKSCLFLFERFDELHDDECWLEGMDGSMWDGLDIYTFGSEHIERHACTDRDTKTMEFPFSCFLLGISMYR